MHGNHVMLLRFNLFDFNTQQDHYHHNQYINITNIYPQSPLILLTYSYRRCCCCMLYVCMWGLCVSARIQFPSQMEKLS